MSYSLDSEKTEKNSNQMREIVENIRLIKGAQHSQFAKHLVIIGRTLEQMEEIICTLLTNPHNLKPNPDQLHSMVHEIGANALFSLGNIGILIQETICPDLEQDVYTLCKAAESLSDSILINPEE